MAKQTGGQKRTGSFVVALTLALVVFNRPAKGWLILLCAGMCACFVYAFSGYPGSGTQQGFRIFVRWAFLVFLCAIVSAAWGRIWWPAWQLTGDQKTKIASIASEMPKDLSLVVEYPPAYNALGQEFGEELRKVFDDNTKGRVNRITVIHALSPELEGLAVLVPQELLDGSICTSYRYGTALYTVMAQAGIQSTLANDGAQPGLVDCSSVVGYVGKKPKD